MKRHPSRPKRLSWIALFCAIGAASLGCGSTSSPADAKDHARDPAELNVALVPDEAAAKIIQDYQGLKEYLTKELGKPIHLHVLTNYAAMIEAVTLDDAHRVAKRLLDKGLLVTVVGKPQGFASSKPN